MTPSRGHCRRLCLILRGELWRQARHFKDCLRVTCAQIQGDGRGRKLFLDWCKTSEKTVDWLWNNALPHLPQPDRAKAAEGRVIVLGDQILPDRHKKLLGLGPKFCVEPTYGPAEKIALNRSISRCVPEEDRPRFIAETVDVISRTQGARRKPQPVRECVEFADPGENMTVEGNITGLPKGPHGFHVHQYGDLRNGCASTGGHYNPLNKSHGAPDAAERHVGDLGNINASESGPLSFCLSDQLLNLTGENSIIGRAIVVHAEEDDLGLGNHSQSLTTGNAGARLACCVIGIAAS
ncbi:uncharacterized protein LOC144178855 isoform X1 [Haemaphysalis longicornis]